MTTPWASQAAVGGGATGQLYDKWVFPNYIKANAIRMRSFLGEEAYAIYNDLSPESQQAARSLIEGNLEQYDT